MNRSLDRGIFPQVTRPHSSTVERKAKNTYAKSAVAFGQPRVRCLPLSREIGPATPHTLIPRQVGTPAAKYRRLGQPPRAAEKRRRFLLANSRQSST